MLPIEINNKTMYFEMFSEPKLLPNSKAQWVKALTTNL